MGFPNLSTFSRVVAAAGTQVRLSATQRIVQSCTIMAESGNSGNIYVGDSNVDNTYPIVLDAGDQLVLNAVKKEGIDLSEIWIDAGTNGDGVIVTCSGGIHTQIIKA
jgi:hypothetical protein